MIARYATIALALALSLGLLGACSASSDSDSNGATSTQSEEANTALAEAWAKARAGKNPTSDCADVKGNLLTDESPAARAAVAQCNFDIPVRYFNTLLDQVDAGTLECTNFMVAMSTQLSTMTMSTEGLK